MLNSENWVEILKHVHLQCMRSQGSEKFLLNNKLIML